jgi:hypothetical protein
VIQRDPISGSVMVDGERTALTTAQLERLDQIAEDRPDAKVIGWSQDGPVIRVKNKLVHIHKRVTREGRLIPAKEWAK